jgi:hypothetical protein
VSDEIARRQELKQKCKIAEDSNDEVTDLQTDADEHYEIEDLISSKQQEIDKKFYNEKINSEKEVTSEEMEEKEEDLISEHMQSYYKFKCI